MFDTYVGTTNGVYRLTDSGVDALGLESERIWALYAWREDDRLTAGCVAVDVGVVSLQLGPVEHRRLVARQIAHDLLTRADRAMYLAKMEKAQHVEPVRVRIDDGVLAEFSADGTPERELAS